jgi:hypothetical protein
MVRHQEFASVATAYKFREELVTDTVLRRHLVITAENRFTTTASFQKGKIARSKIGCVVQ